MIKDILLNDGTTIPELGYGVYLVSDRDQCRELVLETFKEGYRHIDTAQCYLNERAVGDAIRLCGIPREELYITTKIWICDYGYEKAKQAIEDSLRRLGVEYIDLMLLHQRYRDYIGAWKALEEAQREGKIKSIGVSNFRIEELKDLIEHTDVIPCVNQIECHPYYQREELKEFMKQYNIKTEAWYPLGHGDKKLLKEPVFVELGKKYNKTPAQIILRWHLQCDHIVFPNTKKVNHIKENLDIYDFVLTEEEMQRIKKLDKKRSYLPLPEFLLKLVYLNMEKVTYRKKEDFD